ncbi:MAG: hypothetical protein J0L77_00360 [Alphaproteobacteria bacterium]|nr:hypothetical protein [Alphaproteobacteria bacterium]
MSYMLDNPDFQRELDKIAQDQAEILKPFGGSKVSYFHAKGVFYVESEVGRSYAIGKILKQNPVDDLAIFSFFSIDYHRSSRIWISHMAKKFAKRDSPIYRPSAVFPFLLQAAILGETRLYERVAKYYMYGGEGVDKDYEKAAYWFLKHFELDPNMDYEKSAYSFLKDFELDPNLMTCLTVMKIFRDALGFDAGQTHAFPPSIAQMIVKAAEIDSDNILDGTLKYTAATFLVDGYAVERNEALAVQYYKDLLRKDANINFFPLRALVIRYALGLGIQADVEKAKKLLADHPDKRCDCHNYYAPIDELLLNAHKPEYQAIIQLIRTVYHHEDAPQLILQSIQEHYSETTRANFLVLNAMKSLARTENWGNVNGWVDAMYHTRLSYYGFNPEKVIQDTWRLGPFYNAVARNGLPVLGELHHEHFGTPQMPDGLPIEPGIIAFHGLTTTPDGQIKFKFSTDEASPAYLLPEDIDAALVLAYGYRTFQWPSIDISQHPSNHGSLAEAQLKGVEPAWLIETPIGPTLYITDFLGGRLAWDFKEFDISDSDLGNKGKRLVEQLKSIDAPEAFLNPTWAINVNAKDVILSIDECNNLRDPGKFWLFGKDHLAKLNQVFKLQEKAYDVTVSKVIMRISGGYKNKDNSENDRKWLFQDDMRFRHNQICAKLTEEFDTVAEIIPVYERLRQFTGLIYALHAVREKGFEPNTGLKKYIELKRSEFEQRIVGKAPEYARSLPFFDKKPQVGC